MNERCFQFLPLDIKRCSARLDFNIASFWDFEQRDGSGLGNVSVVFMVREVLTHHTSHHMADNLTLHFACSKS